RINPTYSYLTNLEVMQILQKIKSTKKKFGMRNLATVTYEALQYLEESPCKTQTRENIVSYVKDLSSYRLKSHEILQMINDPPTSALHTQLVRIGWCGIYQASPTLRYHYFQLIDDNKAPLTDEENEKIIQLSYKHFHGGETKETPAEKPAEASAKTTGKQSGKRAAQAKSNPAAETGPPAPPSTETAAAPPATETAPLVTETATPDTETTPDPPATETAPQAAESAESSQADGANPQ
ncbi:hypothetical protein KR084_002839, partial [Drosophila pseudotakahashii]